VEDETLALQLLISRNPAPNPHEMQFLQKWMKSPSMGSIYLIGPDADVWEKPDPPDLLSLKPGSSQSALSSLLSNRVVHWYHRYIGQRFRVGAALAVSYRSSSMLD
jgi:hypothetical protein